MEPLNYSSTVSIYKSPNKQLKNVSFCSIFTKILGYLVGVTSSDVTINKTLSYGVQQLTPYELTNTNHWKYMEKTTKLDG